MDWFLGLRPIRLFSFYLVLFFFIGTWMRISQYRTVLGLLSGLKSRWPNLTKLVLAHRHIFLTWGTMRPTVLVLSLLLINLFASQLIWPQAQHFLVRDLVPIWPAIPVILLTGLAMVGFDIYGVMRVGTIDQPLLEGYFDQAESWLRGWKAPVVRVLSFGYVNPRAIVTKEVRTALESVSQLLNSSLWWVSIQTTLRILHGLSLWGSYALDSWLRTLTGA